MLLLLLSGLLAASASAQGPPLTRSSIYRALESQKIFDADRQLAHFSHVCSLRIGGANYPVVDIRELVPGAATPRGVNRIIVVNPRLAPVRQISYTTQRPLFCAGNRLFVYGDLEVDNSMPEGNVLTFTDGGKKVQLSRVEANEYPLHVAKERKGPPQ